MIALYVKHLERAAAFASIAGVFSMVPFLRRQSYVELSPVNWQFSGWGLSINRPNQGFWERPSSVEMPSNTLTVWAGHVWQRSHRTSADLTS